jgi:4-carboxymuconolactone decarboxylase
MTEKLAPRIEPLPAPYSEDVKALLASLMPPGMEPLKLFTTLARHPGLLKLLVASGHVVYRSPYLEPNIRELVIQRVCARKNAEYEWGVHARLFGKSTGLTGERLRTVTFEDSLDESFGAAERAVVAAVDDLCDLGDVSDASWTALRNAGLSDAQVIEVIALSGLYHMIAFLVRALRVEREEFAQSFEALRTTPSR